MSSLKHQTVGALLWNLFDRIGQQLLLSVVVIIIANKLSVEDYTLVGMLAIFTAISSVLLDSGFNAALIRKNHATDDDFSSVFWFNVGMGITLYLLLQLCAPLIAGFFGKPELVNICAIIFLAIPINSLVSIQYTIFNKQVKFNILARVNMIALSVAGVAQLIMAFSGCGVWTLAFQPVILASVKALLLWVQSSWRPKFRFSTSAIRELWAFASRLLAASLINTTFMNIYSVVIGKVYFDGKQLGYYTQGNKMCDMGVSMLYSSIQAATYPIFSSIQEEEERLLRAFRKTIRFTSFLALPAMAGLIVVARPLIELLLKEDWWPAIPFFQLLCLGGCFTILTAVNNNFIKVKGRSDSILHIEYFRVAITIITLLLTYKHSVLTMVAGLVVTRLLIFIIHSVYTSRHTGYTVGMQLSDILPYLLLTLVMSIATYSLSFIISNNLLLLITQVATGGIIYLIMAYISGSKILQESLELLLSKRKSK